MVSQTLPCEILPAEVLRLPDVAGGRASKEIRMAESNKAAMGSETKMEIDNVKLSDARTSPEGEELTPAEQEKVAGGGSYGGDGSENS
jgi:hypothetical protein